MMNALKVNFFNTSVENSIEKGTFTERERELAEILNQQELNNRALNKKEMEFYPKLQIISEGFNKEKREIQSQMDSILTTWSKRRKNFLPQDETVWSEELFDWVKKIQLFNNELIQLRDGVSRLMALYKKNKTPDNFNTLINHVSSQKELETSVNTLFEEFDELESRFSFFDPVHTLQGNKALFYENAVQLFSYQKSLFQLNVSFSEARTQILAGREKDIRTLKEKRAYLEGVSSHLLEEYRNNPISQDESVNSLFHLMEALDESLTPSQYEASLSILIEQYIQLEGSKHQLSEREYRQKKEHLESSKRGFNQSLDQEELKRRLNSTVNDILGKSSSVSSGVCQEKISHSQLSFSEPIHRR